MSTPTEAGIYIRKDTGWDDNGWTSVPNAVIRHTELSWDAKGAFAWLASHRESFRLKAEDLAGAGPKGRNHAREMLRELEKHGWLTRAKHRNPTTGRYDIHVYALHPVPVPPSERTYVPSTAKPRRFPQASPATDGAGAGADQEPDQESDSSSTFTQVNPATDCAGAGRSGAGRPGPGPSGDIEKTNEKEPPNPPASGGPQDSSTSPAAPPDGRCEAHGQLRCRPCGLSPRAQARAERDREAAALAEREQAGRMCPMCTADGTARDGGTRWIRVFPGTQEPITPYRVCDHETPHEQVRREIAAEEAAAEQARRARPPAPAPRCSTGSIAAREALNEARARRRTAAAVSAGTSGHEEAAAPFVDQGVPV